MYASSASSAERRQAVSVEGYFCRRESFRNLGPHDNVLRVGE